MTILLRFLAIIYALLCSAFAFPSNTVFYLAIILHCITMFPCNPSQYFLQFYAIFLVFPCNNLCTTEQCFCIPLQLLLPLLTVAFTLQKFLHHLAYVLLYVAIFFIVFCISFTWYRNTCLLHYITVTSVFATLLALPFNNLCATLQHLQPSWSLAILLHYLAIVLHCFTILFVLHALVF